METSLPALPPAEVNLRDYLDILRRRKAIMLQTFVVVVAVGFIVTLISKPVYEASAKLLVISGMPGVNINNTDNPLNMILQIGQPDSVATQVEVLQSDAFLSRVRKATPPPASGNAGVESIRVAVVEGTNVIRVSVQANDRDYCQRLANNIVQFHNDDTRKTAGENIERALEFVTTQAKVAKESLASTETALEDYRRSHRTDQLQKEADAKRQTWTDVDQKLREAALNLELAQSRQKQLVARLKDAPPTIEGITYRPNPRYERAAAKLDTAQEQFATAQGMYRPDSEYYRAAESQLKVAEAQLAATRATIEEKTPRENPAREALETRVADAEVEVKSLGAQEASLRALHDRLKENVDVTGPWEVRLAALQREHDQAEKAYLELTNRQRDLEIRKSATKPTNRVIEPAARPLDPIRPKKATNIMLSIALALCLGVVMAFLQEYLDDRINSPEDADRAAHLPLLGHVPAIPDREPTVVTNLPARSHVAEAYRTLRSSIGFAGVETEKGLHTIMITSASKGEGKTVTSLNLAIAMALDGKQVILIDSDLRRPSVHKRLNLPQGPGLTDVLVGQQEVEAVLNPTEVAGLRVMSAGPIPPNPAELLNSQPMDRIIEELRGMADIVIFDSAPCIPVSDSIVLSSKVDGVVLVVHAGETKKAAIKHTREMLDRARARTIGIVFNRVPQRKGGYYYYYYYYYGGYYEEGPDQPGRGRKGRRRAQPSDANETATSALARRETRSEQATHETDQEEAS